MLLNLVIFKWDKYIFGLNWIKLVLFFFFWVIFLIFFLKLVSSCIYGIVIFLCYERKNIGIVFCILGRKVC